MSIQSLSVAEGSVLATVVFVLVTVGPFVLIRRVFPAEATEDLKAVASWGALRIGSIHALILALVFTEVRQEYNHLAETIDQEALAIEQLYRSLEQIEGAESEGIRQQLTRYTRMVIDQEWPSLASRQPLESAVLLVNDIRENLFKLSLSNEYIQYVQALIVDVDDIENMRGQRTLDIDEPVATIFWVISVLGYVFTSLCFFVYRATWPRCAVLAMFASINGIVLYSIIALTHPFVGGAAITPTALETVLARTMAAGP